MRTARGRKWNVIGGAMGAGACCMYVAASGSRPASTVWTLIGPTLLASVLAVACGAIATRRLRPTLMFPVVGSMFVISVGSLTAGQPVAQHVFRSKFADFAEQARGVALPTTERFRIGPFEYDRVCVSDDSVIVWDSGDDYFVGSALLISLDGQLENVTLKEGDAAFTCAAQRRR